MPWRCLILILLVPFVAFSQKDDADSLSVALRAAREDTTKVVLLNELVLSIRDKDPGKAFELSQQTKQLAEKLGYQKGLGNTLQNIGWIYYRKGDYPLALKNSLDALAINKAFGDRASVANNLNNLGAIQYEQKQYANAVSYFKQGYTLSRAVGNNAIMSRSLNNISFCYIALKQLDSAEYFVKIAIDEGIKAGDVSKAGFSERILGDIYFEKKEWKRALESFTKCLASARQNDQTSLIVSTLHRIGRTHLKLNKPDAALPYLLENAIIAKQLGYKDELEKTYALLVDAYVQKNNLAQAFHYQTLFIQIHDSLYNQNSAQQIAQMESRYKDEIKEAKIALLTKDKQLQEKEINSQRTVIYAFIFGMAMLGILAFILFTSFKQVSKVNRELAEKNEEIVTQSEQLGQINLTKDKLFSIIGHDLRSPIASLRGLMGLVSGGNLSQEEFIETSQKVRKNLDYLSEDLDNLLNWAHSQLGGQHPNPKYVSLENVVIEKINFLLPIAAEKNIYLKYQKLSGIEMLIDPDHLALILRNLISNAIKFSHPGGTILVQAEIKSETVSLSVSDEGVGMSEDELLKLFRADDHFTNPGTQKEKGMGIGLMLVKEFVDKNGGKIDVKSETGKGSTFIIEMKGRHVSA